MIRSTLIKTPVPPDTTHLPVDENSADRLAAELELLPPPKASGQALVPIPRLAALLPVVPGDGFVGEFDENDITIPQLKIVAGSGALSEKFNVGSLLFAGELLFKAPDVSPGAKNPLLRFVPMVVQKQWREKLTQQEVLEERMPRTVDTLEEARRLGGSTAWGEDRTPPRWSESGKCLLLLERPEGSEHPGFSYVVGDRHYAPAVYYCANTAYRHFVKPIVNQCKMTNTPLTQNFWTFGVERTRSGSFNVWVPGIKRLLVETSPAVQELISRFRSAPVVVDNASVEVTTE